MQITREPFKLFPTSLFWANPQFPAPSDRQRILKYALRSTRPLKKIEEKQYNKQIEKCVEQNEK
jgi:hypothetical protein